MKCIQLTTKSWLIGFASEHAGLLLCQKNKYIYLSIKKRIEFNTLDDVIKKFGDLVIEETSDNAISEINSYPVRHPNAVIVSTDPPLYTKGTNLVFVAGYWGLKYPNSWALAFCPKEDTTKTYEAIGPFKNRLEALNQINRMNNLNHIQGKLK